MGYRGWNAQKDASHFISKAVGVFWEYLQRAFREDWRTKLFALLFALSLWFFLLSEHIL